MNKTIEELKAEIEALEKEHDELLEINKGVARVAYTALAFIEATEQFEDYKEFAEQEIMQKQLDNMGIKSQLDN